MSRPRRPAAVACSMAWAITCLGVGVLAADVEVAALATGREASDGHAFQDRERVALHDHAVLERARLRLVGVADEVVGLRGLVGDGCPLAAGREGGTAAPDEL